MHHLLELDLVFLRLAEDREVRTGHKFGLSVPFLMSDDWLEVDRLGVISRFLSTSEVLVVDRNQISTGTQHERGLTRLLGYDSALILL